MVTKNKKEDKVEERDDGYAASTHQGRQRKKVSTISFALHFLFSLIRNSAQHLPEGYFHSIRMIGNRYIQVPI